MNSQKTAGWAAVDNPFWARQKFGGSIKPWHLVYQTSGGGLLATCNHVDFHPGRTEVYKGDKPAGRICLVCGERIIPC